MDECIFVQRIQCTKQCSSRMIKMTCVKLGKIKCEGINSRRDFDSLKSNPGHSDYCFCMQKPITVHTYFRVFLLKRFLSFKECSSGQIICIHVAQIIKGYINIKTNTQIGKKQTK